MSYCYVCPYCGAHLDPGEFCDCVIANYNRLTPENKRKVDGIAEIFLEVQNKNDGSIYSQFERVAFREVDSGYIAFAAIVFSGLKKGGNSLVEGYSRQSFKRAVKLLRDLQSQYPDYATKYEAAIEHIRREWLHREEPARDVEVVNHENQV